MPRGITNPGFSHYIGGLSDNKYERLCDRYIDSTKSPNHTNFAELLYLIDDVIKAVGDRCRRHGQLSLLDSNFYGYAVDAGIRNAGHSNRRQSHEAEKRRLTESVEGFIHALASDSQSHRSQGARPPPRQAGRHPAESSGRRQAPPPPYDMRDLALSLPPSRSNRRAAPSAENPPPYRARQHANAPAGNPPPSRTNRHAGPPRQSGRASGRFDSGQAPRTRFEEESRMNRHAGPPRQSGRASGRFDSGHAPRTRFEEESRTNRHAGPPRQSGRASGRFDSGQAPRTRFEEESHTNRHAGPPRQSGRASERFDRGQALRTLFNEDII